MRLKRQQMQFKIKNTTYRISFSFLALILYVLTVSYSRNIGILLFFATVHEMVHLIFIYRFSVAPEVVSFTIFGANIKRNLTAVNNFNSEIIINASAPVFNVLTGAVFSLLSKFTSVDELFYSDIADINFVLGCFNLIPFHTFDGGNVLKNILLKYFSEKTTEQILTCVSLIVTVVFSFVSIYIFLNYQHNFSLLIMCIYMFLSIIFKKQNYLDY